MSDDKKTSYGTGADQRADADPPGRVFFQQAIRALAAKKMSLAEDLMRRAILCDPDNMHFGLGMGELLFDMGRLEEADDCFSRVARRHPLCAQAWYSLGLIHDVKNQPETSRRYYHQAAMCDEKWAEAFYNLAVACTKTNDLPCAMDNYQKALLLNPQWSVAWCNLGGVYQQQHDIERAFYCYDKAIETDPNNAVAFYNRGTALQQHERFEAAIAAYQQALRQNDNHHKAYHNIGKCHQAQKRYEQALIYFQKAAEADPAYTNTYFSMAGLMIEQQKYREAIDCYLQVIRITPEDPAAHYNLSIAYRKCDELDHALAAIEQACILAPDFAEAFFYRFQLAQIACDWALTDALTDQLNQITQSQMRRHIKTTESPMLSLRRCMNPKQNSAVARTWSRGLSEQATPLKGRAEWSNHAAGEAVRCTGEAVRIGFVSFDFRDHAVAHQIRGLLHTIDRRRFAVYGYACNPDDGSTYRRLSAQACDTFVSLADLSDKTAAERIAADKIDILIEMMGHTQGNRLGICAYRPAPIQVSYLGFLGSTGADFIDYIITDKIVTPVEESHFYTEKPVYMPYCYQVNDNQLPIGDNAYKRSDFMLPEQAVVFCCFNQSYKIERLVFDIWMTLLDVLPHGVLWLLRQSEAFRRRLLSHAEKRGIDRQRLIFSAPMRIDRHLARLKLADLALDTGTYNGGATTANALWAGVPVLTRRGGHFVSRMSASALTAMGLEDLITENWDAYLRQALRIGRDHAYRGHIREKLAVARQKSPFFDTRRFTRDFETALSVMWERFIRHQRPSPIVLSVRPEIGELGRDQGARKL